MSSIRPRTPFCNSSKILKYSANNEIKIPLHTWSWLVTESSWLVGAKRTEPVPDVDPVRAYELWVVSHEYLLNGNPLTWSKNQHKKSKQISGNTIWGTLVVGLVGWTRVHRGRVLPFAGQEPQIKPASQVLLELEHVSPICLRIQEKPIRFLDKCVRKWKGK